VTTDGTHPGTNPGTHPGTHPRVFLPEIAISRGAK
jgi:hypothetical protein